MPDKFKSEFLSEGIPANAISEVIPFKNLKVVIMHCPDDAHCHWTISKLKQLQIHHVFRLCQNSYSTIPYSDAKIEIHDEIKFVDGGVPSQAQVALWFKIIDSICDSETIAIHCVSGIGRAPVLTALAFIHRGMDPIESIEYIRKYRKRAFNNVQIKYLSEYGRSKSCCSIQ
eukprot:NODE_66_length_23959_cov_0.323009.p9 type:complete len:172 gc:universal NODE_66_length_23959_cov_0.323009:2657-2142(-)